MKGPILNLNAIIIIPMFFFLRRVYQKLIWRRQFKFAPGPRVSLRASLGMKNIFFQIIQWAAGKSERRNFVKLAISNNQLTSEISVVILA